MADLDFDIGNSGGSVACEESDVLIAKSKVHQDANIPFNICKLVCGVDKRHEMREGI